MTLRIILAMSSFAVFMSTSAFAVGTRSINMVKRDMRRSLLYIDVGITLKDLTKEEADAIMATEKKGVTREVVRIELTKAQTTAIPEEAEKSNDDVLFFTSRIDPEVQTEASDATQYQIDWVFRIQRVNNNSLKEYLTEVSGQQVLAFKVEFELDQTTAENDSIPIPYTQQLPFEAPTDLLVKGRHEEVVLTVKTKDKVKHVLRSNTDEDPAGAQTAEDTVSSVYAIMFDPDIKATLPLPTREFKPSLDDDPEEEEETCVYNPALRDGEACLTCPKDYTYLDIAALEGIEGATLTAVENGQETFADLVNGESYAFATFYYNQGALAYSTCAVAEPRINYTILELNGQGKASTKQYYCFVATAAYGTPFGPELDALRWFRDHMLMRTGAGSAFVDAYYRWSPPLAEYIDNHRGVAAVVRGLLTVPVMVSMLSRDIAENPFAGLVFALTAAVAVLLIVRIMRQPYSPRL